MASQSKQPAWKSSTYTAPKRQQRKFNVKLNHTSTASKLATPYAARSASGTSGGGVPNRAISNNRTPIVQPYSSFADPHLGSYFTKKFTAVGTPGKSDASPYLANLASTHKRPVTAPSAQATSSGKPMLTPTTSALLGKTVTKRPLAVYRVEVQTGDKKAASTTARVFISLHGTHGKLSKRRLWTPCVADEDDQGKVISADEKFLFPRGEAKVFLLQGPDVGEPSSLTIEHDGLSEKHAWYLQEVVVTNTSTGMRWRFACNRWLSLFHADCHISRDLRPTNNVAMATDSRPGPSKHAVSRRSREHTVYNITVTTGDVRGGGTDANVFVTLIGENGATPKTQMMNGKTNNFDRGAVSVFRMRATRLDKIASVVLEHDNSGFGPGWFLQKVSITDPGVEGQELERPVEYHFPCCQWLARDTGDGEISRQLFPSAEPKDPTPDTGSSQYIVTMTTGDCRGAGTDANVMVTLFGEESDSGPQPLENAKANFERRRVDKFALRCPPLGVIDRIFVGHDNSGFGPGWFLEEVTVEDRSNSTLYTFLCHRWLAKDEDDGEVSRVLEANSCQVLSQECSTPQQCSSEDTPVYSYRVTVWTGDKRFASTDANVSLALHNKCSSGNSSVEDSQHAAESRFQLSEESCVADPTQETGLRAAFSRGAVDSFLLHSAQQYEPISSVTVGHDNRGLNAGWFLEKISIQDVSSGRTYVFLCNKWLDDGEGDRKTERTLEAADESVDSADGVTSTGSKEVSWSVWVWTSDVRDAGTDARVFLQLYGDKAVSRIMELDNEADNFERGELDKFKIPISDVGRAYKLRIFHDNSNPFPGWHLDKIRMENLATGEKYTFQCGQWLSRDDGDGETIRELAAESSSILPLQNVDYTVELNCGQCKQVNSDVDVSIQIFGQRGDTGTRQLLKTKPRKRPQWTSGKVNKFSLNAVSLGDIQSLTICQHAEGVELSIGKVTIAAPSGRRYVFENGGWLRGSGSSLTLHARPQEDEDASEGAGEAYQVTVLTSDVRGAGTDANVFVSLFGDRSTSGALPLKKSLTHKNKFERNQEDVFKVETAAPLGRLAKVRISHDGSGLAAGWHLKSVEVRKTLGKGCGPAVVFPCDQWISKSKLPALFLDLRAQGTGTPASAAPAEAAARRNEDGAGSDAGEDVAYRGEDDDSEDGEEDGEDEADRDDEDGSDQHKEENDDDEEDESEEEESEEEEEECADEKDEKDEKDGTAQYGSDFEEDDDDFE